MERASVALRAGDVALGRDLLVTALRIDGGSEQAWLWMSGVVAAPEEQRYCLRRALALNPRNWRALGGVVELGSGPLACPAFLADLAPRPAGEPASPGQPPREAPDDVDGDALRGAPLLRSLVLSLLLALVWVVGLRLPELLP